MTAPRLTALVALLAIGAVPGARAAEITAPKSMPRVAVVDFVVTGAGEPRYWLGYVYSEVLARRLMRCSGLSVTEPLAARELQSGVSPQDLAGLAATCLELGGKLKVPWVVSGLIEDRGATLVVTPMVASIDAAKTFSQHSVEVPVEKLYEPQNTIILEKYLREMGVRSLPRGEWATLVGYDPALPLDVAELVGEGWRAYTAESPERSFELWKQALIRDPNCSFASEATARASYLYRRVLLRRAIEFYETLAVQEPQNAHAQYHLAQALAEGGEWRRAALKYQSAIDLRPGFVEARIGLGLAWIQLGFLSRAETEFATVLSLDENNYKAMQNLAVVRYRLGRVGDAFELWETILRLYPGDPVAQRNLDTYRRTVTEGPLAPPTGPMVDGPQPDAEP